MNVMKVCKIEALQINSDMGIKVFKKKGVGWGGGLKLVKLNSYKDLAGK